MMKKLYLILTVFMFSQFGNAQANNSYNQLWQQVDKHELENRTKSALQVVETIFSKAKEENNYTQTIKALLHKSAYVMTLEEDAELNIVNEFKSEIELADAPTKQILHSHLANLYWQYFQYNRYKFYNRTTTESKVDPIDFRTWDLNTLFKEIDEHFSASLMSAEKTQSLPISDFDEILHIQEKTRIYRPTLFDVLAHTALNFYTSNENSINRPLNTFEIDDPKILCEAYTSSFLKFSDLKNTSLQAKALGIYQELVAFHFGNPDINPLVMVDIARLLFIHKNAVFTNKDNLFLEVLQNSAENIKHSPLSGLYSYEIAKHYQEIGQTYNPSTSTDHQWKLKQAVDLLDGVIAKFPNTLAEQKCVALKSEIQKPNIQLTTEKYLANNTAGRILVNYKNVEELDLTARKITQKQINKLDELYDTANKQKFINALPIDTSWTAPLKTEHDFQMHGIEISLPSLTNGNYVITATSKNELGNFFSFTTVQITDLAIVETQTGSHNHYQVIDRSNGKPIYNAEVVLAYKKNYRDNINSKTYHTDKYGKIIVAKGKDSWSQIDLTVKKNNETAYFKNYYLNRYYSQNNSSTRHSCFLFTDRSIYRPGQPVYFKGIAIQQENGVSQVLPNKEIEVELHDVNGQKLETLKLTTNEYGSVSGEFILPNSGLTGGYSLHTYSDEFDLSGYASISVEEYKRPKFETNFKPVTETYKINDSVVVKGEAKAYAGSVISGAKVVYRVKRVVNLPRWYYWSRPYFNIAPQEITHGETITDVNGNYEIPFIAAPDNSIDSSNLPTFNFEVTADVTDINGETRSTTTHVAVGYHSLNVTLQVPEFFDKTKKDNKINIASTNLNGEFAATTGEVILYKLQAPDYVLRPRPWAAPDYSGFTKKEFKDLYPHDAFKNENDPSQWEKEKVIWSSNFNTAESKEIAFGKTKNWKSGKYRLELSAKDKFGQLVKDVAIITFSGEENVLADNQLFQVKTDKHQYEIGDSAKVTFLSSAKNLNVTVVIEKDQKITDVKILALNNDSKTISIPLTKDDLGGFNVNYSYAFANDFTTNKQTISVPYPTTDLQIETITFRDKLAPGTEETWSFKIKGPKGEKVSAELLANMFDVSLNQFRPHYWNFNPLSKPNYYSESRTNAQHSFATSSFYTQLNYEGVSYPNLSYDSFDWFGLNFVTGGMFYETRSTALAYSKSPMRKAQMASDAGLDEMVVTGSAVASELSGAVAGVETEILEPTKETDLDAVSVRKNLQETAFFFPKLLTDKDGNVSFTFTTPEALTRWNIQLLAHTKALESSIINLTTFTQKELMVTPNAPRFLREGDTITISSKISNLTNKNLKGIVQLDLTDALTGADITAQLLTNAQQQNSFSIDSLGNTQVSWNLKIPEGLQTVQYRIIAKARDYSDGEQNLLPVLSNRTLVTETLPMWVRSNQTKTFTLDKLKNTSSATLDHHKLTLEMTSNPAWYAVQALPYLMEYPYDCNEQTFSRYYANTLASHIANSNPRIREVFDQWANSDALLSNLEKNQELKSLLIQETPWLRDAQSETEQKKRIGLLFNLNKMKNEQQSALNKLVQNQNSNGAWSWFKGGPDNRYITQHIITGMGHLNKLTDSEANDTNDLSILFNSKSEMIEKAIEYLDDEFVAEYEQMKKYTSNIDDDHLSTHQVHYLYMRSFFPEIETSKKVQEITAYYTKQAQQYWTSRGLYAQGMLALTLHRMNDTNTANKIIRSLEENSITNDELGMYWKSNSSSWFWYQAPIETQSLLIEAFSEIKPTDVETIDNLKIWLLKNKQTNQWSTTKATSEAVYALLLQGSDWLSVTDAVAVIIGGEKLKPSTLEDVKVEAGTGYFKTAWNGKEVAPKMGEVQITKKGNGIAWGALYWQYFEDLDQITSAKTPLQLKKKIFLKKNTNSGEVLSEITDKTSLQVGDLVRIRIELKSDRDMEFIHMKDMRAAGFEPVNVISRYKWQDGLGYYESTKDASTNFFFDYLPKGVYVFEYDVRVNNAGNFSNGITTIESMYAPEFSSHSEGVRVSVED